MQLKVLKIKSFRLFALLGVTLALMLIDEPSVQAKEAFTLAEPESSLAFSLSSEPNRPRNLLIPPLVSLVLPGFDQWWEKQYTYGAIYSGAALSGAALAASNLDPRIRTWGLQTSLAAGMMSGYHSFRTAVKSRQGEEGFKFLKHHETPLELLTAPLNFSYLGRPTTYLGLPGMILGSFFIHYLQGTLPGGRLQARLPSPQNTLYSGAISLNAGVAEEAMFRGWLMPLTMNSMKSEFASNVLTSLVFGAVHYRDGYIPVSQTGVGYYLGAVTQADEWRIGESIFLHTWFDVIVFLTTFSLSSPQERAASAFQLTPVSFSF